MDGHIAQHVAVLDGTGAHASTCGAHDAADVLLAGEAGIGEGDVLHRAVFYVAEVACEVVGPATATIFIDADAAHGVAVAVERAAEGVLLSSRAA